MKSSFIIFMERVVGKRFSEEAIRHLLETEVEKRDYSLTDKEEIVKYIISMKPNAPISELAI